MGFSERIGKHIDGSEKLILKLEQSETGIGFLEGLVRDVRDEIEHTGSLSESGLQQMIRGVDKSWNVYSVKGFAPDLNQRKKAMLQQLDLERSRLDKLKEAVKKRASFGTDSECRGASVPMGDAMDRILRYERHVEQQLYRAMDQLERLQRRRRGESLLPPLKLEIERS